MRRLDWGILVVLFVGLGLVPALAEREEEQGQDTSKKTRLPLKFEKGKEYTFDVQLDPKAMQGGHHSSGSSRQGQNEPGSSSSQGSTAEGSQGGSLRESMMTKHEWQYRCNVKDTSASETTLEVAVEPKSGGSSGSRSSGSSSSSGSESSSSSAGEQKFTVVVDQDGNVKRIDGLEKAFGSSSSSGSQGSGSSTQGALGQEKQKLRDTLREGFVKAQFNLILGANLHQKELEFGKTYPLASATSGSRYGSGSSGSTSESGSSSSGTYGQGQGQGQVGQALAQRFQQFLSTTQIRFDGTQHQEGHEVAFFTILGSESGQTSPSSGRSRDIRPASDTQESGGTSRDESSRSAQGTAGMKTLGQCWYRTDDGICQKVMLGQGSSGAAGSSGTGRSSSGSSGSSSSSGAGAGGEMSTGTWLQIRRTEGGSR